MGIKAALFRDINPRQPIGLLLLGCLAFAYGGYGIQAALGVGGLPLCLAIGLAVPRPWLAWTLRLISLYLAVVAGIFLGTPVSPGEKSPASIIIGFLVAAVALLVAAQTDDRSRKAERRRPSQREASGPQDPSSPG